MSSKQDESKEEEKEKEGLQQHAAAILAFDFDGVICDSADELGQTAWRACFLLWPALFGGKGEKGEKQAEMPKELQASFRIARAILETGYEALLILWCLHKLQLPPTALLEDSVALFKQVVADNKMDIKVLHATLNGCRDGWISSEKGSWMECNSFYGTIIADINAILVHNKKHQDKQVLVYVITTKTRRFAVALLEFGGCLLPAEHVFGFEEGAKEGILNMLAHRHPEAPSSSSSSSSSSVSSSPMYFLEDRLETQVRVHHNEQGLIDASTARRLRLLLAGWGYNTAKDRKRAEHELAYMTLLTLDDLHALMVKYL